MTQTGNTRKNLYFEFNSVSVTNVVISVTATMTAGEVIKCGQFYCGTEIYEWASTVGGSIKINSNQKASILTLSDGSTYKTTDRPHIRGFEMGLMAVSVAEKENFRLVYDYNNLNPFVFIPEPSTPSDDWGGVAEHCNWVNGFDFENYTDNVSVNGFNGAISLLQAGGIG